MFTEAKVFGLLGKVPARSEVRYHNEALVTSFFRLLGLMYSENWWRLWVAS